MKIKIALVSGINAREVSQLAALLEEAVKKGEMEVADTLTEKMLSLSSTNFFLSLTEEDWHLLLERIRSSAKDFRADYIISGEALKTAHSAISDEHFAEVANIIGRTLDEGGVLLQLPYEEQDDI